MGLSVDWCVCNIGATKPEEYGWYFQWGGTTPYNSDCTPVGGGDAIEFWFNSNCPYWFSGRSAVSTKWTKYTQTNYYSSTGVPDNKTILEPVDDAAYVHLGEEWRIPTYIEFNELINACNLTWATNYNGSGVNGDLYTLKSDPSKTLFFPAAGCLGDARLNTEGSFGRYWSSSNFSYTYNSYQLFFNSESTYTNGTERCYGQSVRAVRPK